eukprot:COSAG01_NODE_4805_length_4730_cov_579.199482_5_plen_150_part_00
MVRHLTDQPLTRTGVQFIPQALVGGLQGRDALQGGVERDLRRHDRRSLRTAEVHHRRQRPAQLRLRRREVAERRLQRVQLLLPQLSQRAVHDGHCAGSSGAEARGPYSSAAGRVWLKGSASSVNKISLGKYENSVCHVASTVAVKIDYR